MLKTHLHFQIWLSLKDIKKKIQSEKGKENHMNVKTAMSP